MRAKLTLPFLLIFSVFLSPARGQEEAEGKTQKNIKTPSPDRRFAFLETVTPPFEREGTVDLIEQKSQKVLLQAESEINAGWSALWGRDSKRVVVTSRVGHAIQGIDVFLRIGGAFRAVKLPAMTASIPARLTRGRKFAKWSELNFQRALQWRRDGSLEMEIQSMEDGEEGSATATRKVVLGFDRKGRASILQSSTRYSSEK